MSVFAEEEKKKEKTVKPVVQTKETVQRDLSAVNGPEGGMLPEAVSAKIQSKRGSGQRLSDRNLQQYSQKFGRDMSDVHVHTDAESDTISRSLNARAFTIGSDVFLSKGINPDGGGRDAQTMAHELTHVVQQGGHAGSGRLKLGAVDTAQEHEAESTAQREFSPVNQAENAAQREPFPEKEAEPAVQRESFQKHETENAVQREPSEEEDIENAVRREPSRKHEAENAVQREPAAEDDVENAVQREPAPEDEAENAVQREPSRKHETESTVRRESSPKLETEAPVQTEISPRIGEEGGTIQRGFFGTLGGMIGHNFMGMLGLEDAYNATYGAKHKVQAAVSMLEPEDAEKFQKNEEFIAENENTLTSMQNDLRTTEDEATRQRMQAEYTLVSKNLAERRQQQLELIKEIDSSISDSDMIQYRNKNSGRSMALGLLGSSILGGFARDGNREKASAAGMLSGANYGAGARAYTPMQKKEKKDDDPKIAALQQELQELKAQIASMKSASNK